MLTTTIPASVIASTNASGAEAKLISVLQSADSSYEDKHHACRELALKGTTACIPALAELLIDEETNHIARYALEPIPDPAVKAALRDALPKTSGRATMGVILSLGILKDKAAVPVLTEHLGHSNNESVQHAARALGAIGTEGAAEALQTRLGSAEGENLLAICEGLLRCADSMLEQGKTAAARSIYSTLKSVDEPPHQLETAINQGMSLL